MKLPLILRNKEQTFRLSELATMLPDEPCYDTVRKWCCVGVDGPTSLVKLEKINSPVGYKSSVEAYMRFIAALNGCEYGEHDE